jgi:Trk-type K+ transport system membrane component
MAKETVDLILLWFISTFASATIVGARIAYALWRLSPDPPDDPVAAAHWLRRRKWLTWSELSALPAFGTAGVTATVYWSLSPIASVMISMVLGGIGFSLLLDALQFMFRKRIGMEN